MTSRAAVAAKLSNTELLAKAPEPIVEEIRSRADAVDRDIERLRSQLAALA